jgi:hypothetical protein
MLKRKPTKGRKYGYTLHWLSVWFCLFFALSGTPNFSSATTHEHSEQYAGDAETQAPPLIPWKSIAVSSKAPATRLPRAKFSPLHLATLPVDQWAGLSLNPVSALSFNRAVLHPDLCRDSWQGRAPPLTA